MANNEWNPVQNVDVNFEQPLVVHFLAT